MSHENTLYHPLSIRFLLLDLLMWLYAYIVIYICNTLYFSILVFAEIFNTHLNTP